MKYLKWTTFEDDCSILAEKIRQSGKSYDKIVCITRGGVFVGGLLAHFLGLHNLTTIALRLYAGPGVTNAEVEELSSPDLPKPGARILVVDDLLDSGRTFDYIKNKWQDIYDLDFAVLYDKGGGSERPDFCASNIPTPGSISPGKWLTGNKTPADRRARRRRRQKMERQR